MAERVVWDHEAAGSLPVISTSEVECRRPGATEDLAFEGLTSLPSHFAGLAQWQQATDLNPVQCRFESDIQHYASRTGSEENSKSSNAEFESQAVCNYCFSAALIRIADFLLQNVSVCE